MEFCEGLWNQVMPVGSGGSFSVLATNVADLTAFISLTMVVAHAGMLACLIWRSMLLSPWLTIPKIFGLHRLGLGKNPKYIIF